MKFITLQIMKIATKSRFLLSAYVCMYVIYWQKPDNTILKIMSLDIIGVGLVSILFI